MNYDWLTNRTMNSTVNQVIARLSTTNKLSSRSSVFLRFPGIISLFVLTVEFKFSAEVALTGTNVNEYSLSTQRTIMEIIIIETETPEIDHCSRKF